MLKHSIVEEINYKSFGFSFFTDEILTAEDPDNFYSILKTALFNHMKQHYGENVGFERPINVKYLIIPIELCVDSFLNFYDEAVHDLITKYGQIDTTVDDMVKTLSAPPWIEVIEEDAPSITDGKDIETRFIDTKLFGLSFWKLFNTGQSNSRDVYRAAKTVLLEHMKLHYGANLGFAQPQGTPFLHIPIQFCTREFLDFYESQAKILLPMSLEKLKKGEIKIPTPPKFDQEQPTLKRIHRYENAVKHVFERQIIHTIPIQNSSIKKAKSDWVFFKSKTGKSIRPKIGLLKIASSKEKNFSTVSNILLRVLAGPNVPKNKHLDSTNPYLRTRTLSYFVANATSLSDKFYLFSHPNDKEKRLELRKTLAPHAVQALLAYYLLGCVKDDISSDKILFIPGADNAMECIPINANHGFVKRHDELRNLKLGCEGAKSLFPQSAAEASSEKLNWDSMFQPDNNEQVKQAMITVLLRFTSVFTDEFIDYVLLTCHLNECDLNKEERKYIKAYLLETKRVAKLILLEAGSKLTFQDPKVAAPWLKEMLDEMQVDQSQNPPPQPS